MAMYQGNGFQVEPAGMHALLYYENGRMASIQGEPLILDARKLTTSGYVIYTGTAWWKDQAQQMSAEEKTRLIAGVTETFHHWGTHLEVED
ncbi:hypothetical protein Enr10x_30080 [Gimesia panareensis]|uniref:Uncharacterized protein n=1 Tax=Gimesia panareensis TaxID=2527978 RepID=A0A517Q7T4_9PLAN|nr:hypothetical protein [Gimesia panareensis]QDT27690.1 hypothetical protein Enr10x_30080 [Gimesia panareensis]